MNQDGEVSSVLPHDKCDQFQSFKSIKASVKCKNTLGLTNPWQNILPLLSPKELINNSIQEI